MVGIRTNVIIRSGSGGPGFFLWQIACQHAFLSDAGPLFTVVYRERIRVHTGERGTHALGEGIRKPRTCIARATHREAVYASPGRRV